MTGTSATGWDHFDVEANVGVRGWGPSPADAFAQIALGTLALTVLPQDVQEQEHRAVRAQGDSAEALLVNWVNECLYVHEIEGFVVRRVEVVSLDETVVHGELWGEPLDRSRHRLGTVVKAATAHRAALERRENGFEARLVLDV